jgi:hypothetical protein
MPSLQGLNLADACMILLAVVLCAALVELLLVWGRLLKHEYRSRFSWIHFVWTALLFVGMVKYWWIAWKEADFLSRDFGALLVSMLTPLAFYASAALLSPRPSANASLDLEAHFFTHRRAFFMAMTCAALLDIPIMLIYTDFPFEERGTSTWWAVRIVLGTISALGYAIANRTFHRLLAAVATAALLGLVFSHGFLPSAGQ